MFNLLLTLGYFALVQAQDEVEVELPNEIELFVTYRDFLSVHCLNDDRIPGGKQFIQSSWNRNNIGLSSNDFDSCREFFQNSDYLEAMERGDISGHPDFEASGHFVNQNNCDGVDPAIGLNFPVGTCIFQENGDDHQIVSQLLATGRNGLPLIQYCKDDQGDDSRCGFVGDNGRQTQTTKGNFDKWFNDDAKFNRRVGQRLVLTRAGNSESFEFIDRGADSPDFDEGNGNQFGPLDMFKKGGSREIFLDTDPNDVPAWPQSAQTASRAGTNSLRQGFWFTSEIHTTFEFRVDAEMTFTFSGDDDFYAFINGQLAVDVGGMHSSRRKTINLLDGNNQVKFFELLGLEDGEVYTLDIYHAERQRGGSNFQLETTLFAACNVQQSGGATIDSERDFGEFDFIPEEVFLLEGVSIVNSSIQLLSEEQTFSSTHIFSRTQENLAPGFQAKFLARVDGEVEGFAFVIQSFGLVEYPRTLGRTFNFQIPNSLAVVFDLCATRDLDQNCNSQEVRLHYPSLSNETNNAESVLVEDGGSLRVFDNVLRDLKRQEAFPVEIIFFGQKPDFLEVYVNNSLYLRQTGFDVIDAIGTAGAHVGFTSTSLEKAADIVIEKFELNIVEVDNRRTRFVEGEENKVDLVVADGENLSEGFVIFTEDLCADLFQSGTLENFIDAKYYEIPDDEGNFFGEERTIVDAVVDDNLDGTYNLQLQTVVPAEYRLAMAFGDKEANCTIDFIEENRTQVINGTEVIVLEFVPILLGSLADCSFVPDFQGSLVATPPTDPPTSSPTEGFEIDIEEADDLNIAPFLGIGGGLCALSVLFALAFMLYRSKWRKDKKFVASGNAYKLELNTQVAGQEEYTAIGNAVLASQKEILALQATAADNPRTQEIDQLQNENAELREIITTQKQTTYESNVAQEVARPKRNRVEF